MKRQIGLMLILAGMAAPVMARASLAERPDMFKAEIGPAIPMGGDLDKIAETGFMVGGQWIHRMSPDFGLGAELSFTKFGEKSESEDSHVNVDMWTIMGLSRFNLSRVGSKAPYLLAGLGLTEVKLDVTSDHHLFDSDSNTESDGAPSFLVGGGIDIPFEKFALGLEGRYQYTAFTIGSIEGGGALQLLGQLRW